MFNTFARKIGGGYLSVILVLLFSGGFVYWQTRQLAAVNEILRQFRSPTVEAGLTLLSGVNESQSAIRGWLIRGEDKYLHSLEKTWNEDIETSLAKLHDLSSQFKNPETIAHFEKIQKLTEELRKNQDILAKTKVVRTTIPDGAEDRISAIPLRKEVEALIDFQHGLMESEAGLQTHLIERLNHLQLILIFLGALACVTMAIIVTRAVTGPIDKTIHFADAIATGDYKTEIDISGSVEINRLKVALEKMRVYLENQAWLSRAQLSFNSAIRGVAGVPELAQAAMSALARSIRADVGMFYVAEGETLRASGGYAYPSELKGRDEIKFGEGVAGQAAASRQMITVSAPERDVLPVQTLIGDVRPQQVSALPLVYADNVLGVVEFASLSPLEDREAELLNAVSETLAISLDSVAKNDQVRNLLHETQTQSEELQAQQEELRQSNDELQSRQEELESINEELEEQQSLLRTQKTELDEKNAELEIAQRGLADRAADLERIGKYKSEFLANMSHELRTPLNSQLILAKLLSENREGNLTEKQVQFVKTIHETGLDLLQLINDILDLAKVEAGKLNLEIRSSPLREMIDSLERDFRPTAELRDLEFRVNVDPSLPEHLITDSHRMLQVLRNFLSNAFKFTEKGEVSLSVARWSEGPRKGQIAFRVKDSGIGIPKDKHDLIFNAFEQVDSATTRQYGGTGLGLAISKQIAEILDGEIQMVSEPGRGSEFILIVPEVFKGEAPSAREKKTMPLRVASRSSRVLLVDDDLLLQKQLAGVLHESKFDTTAVATAEEALNLLAQSSFDCIILDIRLPDMSGFEVLRKIKAAMENPPPVIIYTAMELKRGEEEELHRASASIIIKGPKSAERLVDEIRQLGLQKNASKSADALKSKREAIFKGQKVLLVDDDIRNIFALTSALEEQGLTIVIARDGREALDVLAANPDVHLILMDVMMPVMDGHEATRKIKGDVKFADVPVIALTAKAMKEDKELCLAAGANDYLPKPVDLDRLLALMSVWIRN